MTCMHAELSQAGGRQMASWPFRTEMGFIITTLGLGNGV